MKYQQETDNPRILVTGGSGFLGINFIRYLLKKGCTDIRSLDIMPFEYPERSLIDNRVIDIRDGSKVRDTVADREWVIHTAAALPLYSKEDIYTTEVDGTKNILEESANSGVKRFIHISSTAVYGVPTHGGILESDPLTGVGDYGHAKIHAEALCEKYRSNQMSVSILRPKTFIGPERLGVFEILYRWASEGRGFPVIGSGDNAYQLLDVEDLCEAMYLCAVSDQKIASDTYNIGASDFTTIKDDFQAVLDDAGFGKHIVSMPKGFAISLLKIAEKLKLSPIYQWVYETAGKDSSVSIQKAIDKLKYKPRYSNRDALIRNYRWYIINRDRISDSDGISHRTAWNQGILGLVKYLF